MTPAEERNGGINKKLKQMTKKIETARAILETNGYYVRNLWSTIDVMEKFDCSKETAIEVLNDAIGSEYITTMIEEAIDETARQYGLKQL